MTKPSGAHWRKRKKQKEVLERSFDALGEVPDYLKNQESSVDDLSHFASYREAGYNTKKISASNTAKKQKSEAEITRIKNTYNPNDYPSKKFMYLDIAEKENISFWTARKYMSK